MNIIRHKIKRLLWWIFVYPEKFISKLTFNNTKGFISYNSKSQKWDGEVANKDMDLKTGEVKNSKHVLTIHVSNVLKILKRLEQWYL